MSRGRKITINSDIDKSQKLFFENVGFYMSIINKELGKKYSPEPLANFIKIAGGFAFKTSSYRKSGVPIIRISDFNNERIDLSSCVFYDEDASLQKFLLEEGDIIICLTGGTIAKLGIVQGGLGKIYLNQRVGKFEVLDENIFEKEYVYWLAKSVANTIKNLAWGAAIPNVSPKQIEKIQVSIPPKEIQIGIISFLNDLKNEDFKREFYFDPEIEKHILDLHESSKTTNILSYELTHQLSLISQLRQAFLREAMQGTLVSNETSDGKTGADLLEEIKKEKEQLIKDKKIKKGKPLPPISKEEIPFEIPENWMWCRLDEITINCDAARKPISSKERSNLQKVYDYYGASGVIDKIHDFTHEGTFLLIGEDGNNLISRSTPLAFIAKGKFWVNNHAHVLKYTDDTLLHFMKNWLNIFDIRTYLSGGFQPKFSQANMNLVKVPLPPLEIQNRIVAKLDELMQYCDALEASVKESQNYNAQLLQQVLREALEGKEESKQEAVALVAEDEEIYQKKK